MTIRHPAGRTVVAVAPVLTAAWVLAALLLAAACAPLRPVEPPDPEAVRQALLETLGTAPDTVILGMASVDAPDGLWNVHVLSEPPDRVMVYQVRRQSNIEFATDGEMFWRRDVRTDQAQPMPDDFLFFLRSHEILRLGDRVAAWTAVAFDAEDRVNGTPCRELELKDDFDQRVRICLDRAGEPLRIAVETAPLYGGQVMNYFPEEWREVDGLRFMAVYLLEHEDQHFRWNFQHLGEVDPEHYRPLTPEFP